MKHLIAVALAWLIASVASAATATWTGGGADANWQTSANWSSGATPAAGDDLLFPAGAARASNNNDFPVGTLFNSIEIAGTGYTLDGNGLKLQSQLRTTYASGGVTVALPVTLAANAAFAVTGNGQTDYLILEHILTGGMRATLSTATADGFIHAHLIDGTGSVTVVGAGIVRFEDANAYSGGTTVSAGILDIVSGASAGTGRITVSGTGVVVLGKLVSEPLAALPGSVTLANSWMFSSSANPALLSRGYDDVCSGDMILSADTIIQCDAPSLTTSGVISGAGGIVKTGGTKLILPTDNTFTGASSVKAGIVGFRSVSALGASSAGTTVESGAAILFEARALGLGSYVCPEPLTISGAGPTGLGALEVFDQSIDCSGFWTLGATATVGAYVPNYGFEVDRIDGTGGLIKRGLGTLQVSDWSTYAGTTTVSEGVMLLSGAHPTIPADLDIQAGAQVQLSGAGFPFASGVGLTVEAGGKLALGGYTGSVATLSGAGTVEIGHGTLYVGGTSGSSRFDGEFTSVFSPLGRGAVVKSGTGTLTLGPSPDFQGSFVVQGGTLALEGDHHLSPASVPGGTLAASGSLGDVTVSGGRLAPGGSGYATLACSSLSLDALSTLDLDIGGVIPGWNQDQLAVAGAVSLGGSACMIGTPPMAASGAILIDHAGAAAISGTFAAPAPVVYRAGTGNDLALALSGTALPTTVTLSGSGADYLVSVSGMSLPGAVVAGIATGSVHDGGGAAFPASASDDDTVSFTVTQPSVAIVKGPAQADPATGNEVVFAVTFSEAVSGFDAASIALGGTASPTTAIVSGSGTEYLVTVSGMSASGTITAAVAAASARNAAGISCVGSPPASLAYTLPTPPSSSQPQAPAVDDGPSRCGVGSAALILAFLALAPRRRRHGGG